VFSVVSWCFNAAGLVRGLFAPRRPPVAAVASVQVQDKHDAAPWQAGPAPFSAKA
jgi:hypothetical protein